MGCDLVAVGFGFPQIQFPGTRVPLTVGLEMLFPTASDEMDGGCCRYEMRTFGPKEVACSRTEKLSPPVSVLVPGECGRGSGRIGAESSV